MDVEILFNKNSLKGDVIVRCGEQVYCVDSESNYCYFNSLSTPKIDIWITAPAMSKSKIVLAYLGGFLLAPFYILLQYSDSNWTDEILPFNQSICFDCIATEKITLYVDLPQIRMQKIYMGDVQICEKDTDVSLSVTKFISQESINMEMHRYLRRFFSIGLVACALLCAIFILSTTVSWIVPVAITVGIWLLLNILIGIQNVRIRNKLVARLKGILGKR